MLMMGKESLRKCSHCGHNGHNSRTCNSKGCFKLFGVRIDLNEKEGESAVVANNNNNNDFVGKEKAAEFIRRAKSMGNLAACSNEQNVVADEQTGYHSDGFIQNKRAKSKKKGRPWTEEEHRSFLVGLEHLGKGDWRGISKNYVPSRSPTQVASHAQKYFIRLAATDKTKRRSSLFDKPFKDLTQPRQQFSSWPPIRAAETMQLGGSFFGGPLKIKGDGQGHASISTAIGSADKPPLSPVAGSFGVADFRYMPYMMGLSRDGQSVAGPKVFPSISLVPTTNLASQSSVYLPPYATCAPYMSQPSSSLVPKLIPHNQSEAAPSTSGTKKDGLDLSIRALEIKLNSY